jgi:hypothetical protein
MYFCVSLLVALSLLAHAIAQPQNSRARSAASYVERGSAEYAKGEWDKAIPIPRPPFITGAWRILPKVI